MITHVKILNYKSIIHLELDLGRINVFIGENGCGKTNVLEAIALGSAAARDKLDNEFLAPRGIRLTAPAFMKAAFSAVPGKRITVHLDSTEGEAEPQSIHVAERNGVLQWHNDGTASAQAWRQMLQLSEQQFSERIAAHGVDEAELREEHAMRATRLSALAEDAEARLARFPDFLLFAPENTALRNLKEEAQILPLGVKGEGLLAHLQALASQPGAPVIAELNEHLKLLDWFETLQVPGKDMAGRALRIRDRYLSEGVQFDQRSANEGFLFLLFYFTLFASPETPRFFAIDNVDASLNPKMCAALTRSMVSLAKKHDKQAIVTTHNPSLLDGLDLTDDEQRLFVVSRRDDGSTRIRRVAAPKPLPGDAPVRLSDAFVRGYIGGLPKNF